MADYAKFEDRLKNIVRPDIAHHVIGHVHEYGFHCLFLGQPTPSKRNLLLSAGVHGDEPAGVEAVLQFLERDLEDIIHRFHIVVLPCVNPSGYASNLRENIDGQDINRSFKGEAPEFALVREQISGCRFDVFLDMHEDYDASGTYFYEGKRDEAWLAPSIAQRTKKFGSLDADTDEADIPLAEGVFQVDPAWDERGFTSYVYEHHADHVIITETSSSWPLQLRVKVHLLALDLILDHYWAQTQNDDTRMNTVTGTDQKENRMPPKDNPAFEPIKDEPGLPRVLIIGDSISVGYTLPLRELLKGKANLHRPLTNCGPTQRGIEEIEDWLGDGSWDVIHFNWGLHDIVKMTGKGEHVDRPQAQHRVRADQYEQNLDILVRRLRQTGANLVWCATTPVPQGASNRKPGDEVEYNAIAQKVMDAHGVPTNDLYTYALERLHDIQLPANVHFTTEGSATLAEPVARHILDLLGI